MQQSLAVPRKPRSIAVPFFLLFTLFIMASSIMAGQAIFVSVKNQVEIQAPGESTWEPASKNKVIYTEYRIRTGRDSSAKIKTQDSSLIDIKPQTEIRLGELSQNSRRMDLEMGRVKAIVKKSAQRSFEIKTPVGVASVRGTEFSVSYDEDNRMSVDVDKGIVGVYKNDEMENEVLVHAGERLDVFPDRALEAPAPNRGEGASDEDKQTVKAEVGLDMSKEQVMLAAAEELKLAEYQEGKTLIDVSGQRVRLEEYIMRPRSDQFKLVALNDRSDRFDYFYYLGTFNTTLPTDLSVALKEINGKVGSAAPDYYLTGYETGRSNTQDSVQETASGGHSVDVNSNSDISDDISSVYDSETDSFRSAGSGEKVWKTLFDYYSYKLNGTEKQGWNPGSSITPFNGTQGTGIQSYTTDIRERFAGDYMTTFSDYPSGTDILHQRITRYFGNGTWEQYDNYIISDEGEIAPLSAFNNVTSGSAYKQELLKWNYEQVITASEFQGRKIDLVIEPKILIKSGLIE